MARLAKAIGFDEDAESPAGKDCSDRFLDFLLRLRACRHLAQPCFMTGAKVLIVTSELHGGSASYVVQLAGILNAGGVQVAATYFANHRHLEAEIAGSASPIFPLRAKFSEPRGFLGNVSRIRVIVDEFGPDVIYTNTVFPMIALALLRCFGQLPRNVKLVHTLHSLFCDKFGHRVSRGMADLVERLMGRFVDLAIAPSGYMARRGAAIYGTNRVRLIKNSLSERLERKLLCVREARRARSRKPPFRLLFVGRADRQKGLDVLLRAYAEIRRSDAVSLTIAGVTADECALAYQHLGVNLQGIDFLGWVNDTASVYADADVFLMPSRWEAFGLTLLEARFAGLPCVGSSVDAIPELIPSDSGLIVPVGDVDGLVYAIRDVLRRIDVFVPSNTLVDLPTYTVHRAEQLALLESLLAAPPAAVA